MDSDLLKEINAVRNQLTDLELRVRSAEARAKVWEGTAQRRKEENLRLRGHINELYAEISALKHRRS